MNKRYVVTSAGSICVWNIGSGKAMEVEVVFSVWHLKCGYRGKGKLILTSTSSSIRRGEALEVETGLSVGINLLQEEESSGTAALTARQHSWEGSQEVRAPWWCWEIPAMPLTSSGLRSGRGYNSKGGGGELSFKPGFPVEGGGQQRGCQGLRVEKGGGGGKRWVRWICQVDSSTQSFILAMTWSNQGRTAKDEMAGPVMSEASAGWRGQRPRQSLLLLPV